MGLFGEVGLSILSNLLLGEPNLPHAAKLIFTDVETDGKKLGYSIAAAEYEKAFRTIEDEYNAANELLECQKNMYNSQANDLIERLEKLERQKEELEKQVELKIELISIKYSIPISKIQHSLSSGSSVVANPTGDIFTAFCKHKEREYIEAIRSGYLEAKKTYEIKIAEMKNNLVELKKKGSEDIQNLLDLINGVLDSIVDEQTKIAELQILLDRSYEK